MKWCSLYFLMIAVRDGKVSLLILSAFVWFLGWLNE